MYRYEIWFGATHFVRWGIDDRIARRLLARYIRLVYRQDKVLAIADTVSISRVWCRPPAYIVPCIPYVTVESFEVCPESVREFLRIAL